MLGQRLPAEEEAGVFLVENLQAAEGADSLGIRDPLRTWSKTSDATHQPVEGLGVVETRAKVHPGVPGQEARQPTPLGQGGPGQEHRDDPIVRCTGSNIKGRPHFFVFPGAQALRPQKDGASPAGIESRLQHFLPRLARDQVPLVEEHL